MDALALVHLYEGRRTVNGRAGDVPVTAAPGTPVRVRVVNTDAGPMRVWPTGGEFRVVAVDGREVHGPTPLRDTSVEVTAGGRADLEVRRPTAGRRRARRDRRQRGDRARHAAAADPGARRPPSTC